jgi:hypothetical protein
MAPGTIYFFALFPVQFVSKPKEKSKTAYGKVTYIRQCSEMHKHRKFILILCSKTDDRISLTE